QWSLRARTSGDGERSDFHRQCRDPRNVLGCQLISGLDERRSTGGNATTQFSFPLQQLRGAVFISPWYSLESALSISYAASGPERSNFVSLSLGPVLNFQSDRSRTQVFFHPDIAISNTHVRFQSFDEITGAPTIETYSVAGRSVGAGLGFRVPFATRAAARVEGRWDRFWFSEQAENYSVY